MKKTTRRGLTITTETIRHLQRGDDLHRVHGGQANQSQQHSACPNSCVQACAPNTDYTCCSTCGEPSPTYGEDCFSHACGGGA